MFLEIWIVHKDCAIFYPMTHKFPVFQSFLCVSENVRHVFENFQIGTNFCVPVCPEISSMCPETLSETKNIIFAFYHMTQQISRLLKFSGVCP